MRKIKYRGFNQRSGWSFGTPLFNKLGSFIITEKNPHLCNQYGYIEIDEFMDVISETVGQYAGLKDVNGAEVFEGDVIETTNIVSYLDRPARAKIEWFEDRAHFQVNNPFIDIFDSESFKIIGNIYENPKLLDKECE